MRVFLKNLCGEISPLDIEPSDNVLMVKAKIEAKIGLLPKAQRLIYAGTVLTYDERTMSEYKIQEGATVFIVYKGPLPM